MEFIKRQISLVTGQPFGEKIGLLLVLSSLERNLEKTYKTLCRNQELKGGSDSIEPKGGRDLIRTNGNGNKSSPSNYHLTLNLFPALEGRFLVFTSITNYIHSINFIKWLLVAFILETKLWPPSWACYLPGRIFFTEITADVNHALALSTVLVILAWQWIAGRTHNNYELLNIMIFLLTEDEMIEGELGRVRQLNKSNRKCHKEGGEQRELESILQEALFYRLTTLDGLNVYKLRPSRTRMYKSQVGIYFNRFYNILLPTAASYVLILTPMMIYCWLDDHLYTRVYTGCCQTLAGDDTDDHVLFGTCNMRLFTLAFDAVDNLTLLIGSGFTYFLTFSLSTIINGCLVLHWQLIDSRIQRLIQSYKYQQMENSKTMWRLPTSSNSSWSSKRRQPMTSQHQHHLFDGEKLDLQAIITDFFECFRRINGLAGTLIGFTFLLFFNGILTCVYFSLKTSNFYETFFAKYLLVAVYTMFILNSLVVLKLNKIINKSYPQICSLMAADETLEASRWIQIVDIYTNRLDTSYSIFGWRLNWHLIATLIASSLSFLFLVETYKRKNNDLPKFAPQPS